MSTSTSDRLFLLLCLMIVWTILRIIAMVVGLAPWSWWIVIAVLFIAWAFVAWGHLEDVAS